MPGTFCGIFSELNEVQNTSLIQCVLEPIHKHEIRSLHESFCEQRRMVFNQEDTDLDENDTYIETE